MGRTPRPVTTAWAVSTSPSPCRLRIVPSAAFQLSALACIPATRAVFTAEGSAASLDVCPPGAENWLPLGLLSLPDNRQVGWRPSRTVRWFGSPYLRSPVLSVGGRHHFIGAGAAALVRSVSAL
jgi:hypothetical protein